MTSLSRIFKASCYTASEEKVILSVQLPAPSQTDQASERLQEKKENFHPAMEKAEEEASMILRDAEETAQKLLDEAVRQAEEMRQQAREEIEQWWKEKQQELAELAEQVRRDAHAEGFAQGRDEGRAAAREEEQEHIQKARDVLEKAHLDKEEIISEAEPFLVGLSVEIAKKVIGEELRASPEKIVSMVQNVLRRSRVHGQITLCVNHRHYHWVEEHRSQFLALLDGEAELIVLPDYSVHDDGCVIRTPFGSVDARIDTQLTEIKHALMSIAKGREADEHT
ncbi:MAG: flagellar assembly protein FliH [Brevibacillus sp.]|nr:flagellar assembly protein FliH [Brevibacillus sp.]